MLELSDDEQALLHGRGGEGLRLAMRVLTRAAEVMGATRLIPIRSAHIDSCLYHGLAGLDFAERLVSLGARVAVPTTLNVGSLDLLHPQIYRGDPDAARLARRLMDAYLAMNCQPTWTCAPYQLPDRPGLGEHVAWAESNAIVFANSVLGARTARYGDFLDICAALLGRAPYAGLHRSENRRATLVFELKNLPQRLLSSDVLYPVLGFLVGQQSGSELPAIVGLPPTTSEDQLKALGAGAASSGAVAMFHAVGITPEAPTLDAACQGQVPSEVIEVTTEALRGARDALSTVGYGPLAAVSVGTPHFSLREFEQLVTLLHGQRIHQQVDFWVSTGRFVLGEIERRGWKAALEAAGLRIVVDTCTYITPTILRQHVGAVMTNSAKWAYYAPGNIDVEVIFGDLHECVHSAIQGRVWRDPDLWHEE